MEMKRAWTLGIGVFMVILAAGPWGAAVPPAWSEEGPRQRVVVELKEYAFSPKKITLQAGMATELVLVNWGKYMHEFESPYFQELDTDILLPKALIETLGIAEVEVEPGGEVVLRFTPEATGEFPVACHAAEPKDHYGEAMMGTLIVK